MSVRQFAVVLVLVVICAASVDAASKVRSKRTTKAVIRGQRAKESLRFTVTEDPEEHRSTATTATKEDENQDCEIGTWSLATPCNATCGGGYQEFHLVIRRQASGSGKACPATVKFEPCHTDACPIDCIVGAWSEFEVCSAECGQSGTYVVNREVKPGNEKGRRCPPHSEERPCNRFPCPEDCQLSEWKEDGKCSKPCDGGKQRWIREIIHKGEFGGRVCLKEDLEQIQECNLHECPVDCEVTAWEAEGTCDKPCAGGSQNFTRTILTQPSNGGRECPHLRAELPCNMAPCVTDCVVSRWEPEGACSKPCGSGLQNWTRHALVEPSKNADGVVTGRPCPDLFEQRECNTHPCPRDCKVGNWSTTGTCTRTCGGGMIKWIRSVLVSKSEDGRDCPPLEEDRPCSTEPCPPPATAETEAEAAELAVAEKKEHEEKKEEKF